MKPQFTVASLLLIVTLLALCIYLMSPGPRGLELFVIDYEHFEGYEGAFFSDEHIEKILLPDKATISDWEFLEYDWANHSVTISGEAGDKIPRRGEFYVASCYFILSINREPIYIGSIDTSYSSDSHECPTILIDELPIRGKGLPVTLRIDECYLCGRQRLTGRDRRNNERLKNWLSATNRLRNAN